MYRFEQKLWDTGIELIAGIDEAGRGPLAGPVVAAAVILSPTTRIDGVNDSKKLSDKRRRALYHTILSESCVGVGIVDELTIDDINIYQATRLAMKQAVLQLAKEPQYLLIDGPMHLDLHFPSEGIIGGDALSASIAAASIVAKVVRDDVMLELDVTYPMYGFRQHKGYPTKDHIAGLMRYGVSPVHRKSFSPVRQALQSHG
jgi:ribonuclease HII